MPVLKHNYITVIVLLFSGCSATQHTVLLQNDQPTNQTVAETDAADQADSSNTNSDFATGQILLTSNQVKEAGEPTVENDSPSSSDVDSKADVDPKAKSANGKEQPDAPLPLPPLPESLSNADQSKIKLEDVVASVHHSYPLFEAALLENNIADATVLSNWGAFDTKFKAATENGPIGFYRTFRQSLGFNQPIYNGGEIFTGYRIGRGTFEPWYLERETNDGGEFKAGVRLPLLRNRDIDRRRAELWRATYSVQRVRPEVQAQLILFVRDASVAYWNWVAAGRQYQILEQALKISIDRNEALQRRVDVGDLDPPVLQDNKRSIAIRRAKLIDRERKVRQSAVKLSLFLRNDEGIPIIPLQEKLPDFPDPNEINQSKYDSDVQLAMQQRPELAVLDAMYRLNSVNLQEAENNTLPLVDAQVISSQDVGAPTSSKRDKSRFEVQAGIFVDVPLQRRKATGKMQAAEAKLAQVAAKRRFTQDKIVAEIQAVYAALIAAYQSLDQAREAKRLAIYMADVERRKFDLGQSDLLSVYLREGIAIEAAESEVDALLEYFVAQADYAAALARDWPTDATHQQ